jgi:hypothetical protein
MKQVITVLVSVVIVSVVAAGCGEERSHSSAEATGSQLTASDLALLTDYHAWSARIPQSQQPVKRVRLVIVKPDGTIIPKFDTGDNLGPESCASILLGFRVEHGAFTGHIHIRDSKGGGQGWGLSFSDPFAGPNTHWTLPGTLVWNGNRARLAFLVNNGESNGNDLALELLK